MPASLLRSMLLLFVLANLAAAAENWPRWRGPRQDGHSADTAVPAAWDAKQVVWKTSLPGREQSSPIIWENRIFLTSASEDGRRRQVLCVDRTSGKLLWEQTVAFEGVPEKLHKMNCLASASCVTD